MKTLYRNLKVPKLLKLPALIVLLLALSYTGWSQSSNSPVCVPNPILLDAAGGPLTTTNAVSYSWIGNSANVSGWSSTAASPIINYPGPSSPSLLGPSSGYPAGPYPQVAQYAVTIYYSSGPPQTGFINVSCVSPPPSDILTGAGSTFTLCAGNTATQTYYTSASATPAYTYSWTVVPSTGVTLANPTSQTVSVNWGAAAPGSYVVNLTVISGTCSSTVTQTVVINALPVPVVTGTSAVCPYTTGTYSTTTGMTNYIWKNDNVTVTASTTSPTIWQSWATAGTHTITLLYTDANGCAATQTGVKTVTVYPTPVAVAISGNKTICTYGNEDYYITSPPSGTFTWTVQGGTRVAGASGSSITVNWATTGTGTITVKNISTTGCVGDVSTYTVNIAPIGTPVINGAALTCMPTAATVTVTYGVTATNATTYAWTVSGSATFLGGIANAQTVTVIYSATGTYTVEVSASNTWCSATTSKTTYVGPTPTPTVTGTFVVCNNTCANYYTETGMSDYNWVVTSNSTATITAGQGTNSITVCWGATGTGTVQVYATLGSCQAPSAVYTVTISPSISNLRILTVTPPALTQVCENSTGWNYYAAADGAPLTQWEWAVTGPNTTPGVSTITAGQSTFSITASWGSLPGPDPGTVNVVVSRGGCQAMTSVYPDIVTKPVVATPTAMVSATAVSSVCSGTTVRFTTTDGFCNYNWTFPNMVVALATADVLTYTYETGVEATSNWVDITFGATQTATAYVSVSYSNVCPYNGCNDGNAATKSITVYSIPPVPVIVATPNTAVCNNNTVVYTVSNLPALDGTGFAWTTTGSTATANASGASTKTFTVTWTNTSGVSNQTGKVNLTFTSAGGCISTNTLSTTVYPTVTPVINGDASACIGDTKQYTTTTGMANYNWTINNAAASITTGINTATITVKFWVTGQTDLTVTYTDANNCPSGVGTKSVTVHELPVPTIQGPDQACEGTTVTYYTQSGNGEYDYVWATPAGGATYVSGQGTATYTVTWNTMGPRSVSVNYKSIYGCTAVAATVKSVTVGELNVPSIAYPTNSLPVCQYSTGNNYYVSGGHPKAGWIYSWNLTGPNGSIITAGQNTYSVTVTWGGPGTTTGTLWVDATNTNVTPYCTGTSPILFVPILAPPATPTITGNFSVCSGYPAVATKTSPYPSYTYTTDGSMYNYTWTVTGAAGLVYTWTGQGTNQITVWYGNGVAGGNVTVGVTYSNDPANNCKSTYSRIVTVKPNVMPTITATPANVCAGSAQVFNTENTFGITGYGWTVAGNGISGSGWTGNGTATITVNWPASTTPYTGTTTVYYTGVNGCISQVYTKATTVNGQPTTPVIAGPQAVCANVAGQTVLTSVYYCNNTGLNSQYVWTVTGNVTTFTGQGTRTITVTWGAAGTGNVSVQATIPGTGGYCVSVSSVYPVTINPTDVPVIVSVTDPFDIVCQNTGGHVYQTVSGMAQYTWEATGPGTTTTTAGQFTNPVTVFWGGPGLAYGNLRVSVVNTYGCRAISNVKTVTISPAQPTLNGDLVFCGYANTWHTYTAGPSTVGDYVWELGANVVTWTPLTGSQSINVMFAANTSSVTTASYVKVTYTGECSSAQTIMKDITINPIPQPTIIGEVVVCQNNCSEIPTGLPPYYGWEEYFVPNANPTSTFEWSVTGGTIMYGPNTSTIWVCWSVCPTGTLQVTETNSYGCVITSQVYTVSVNPKPAPWITGAETVEPNSTKTYTTDLHGTNLYTWEVIGGTIISGQGTNQIVVEWGPINPCNCGSVKVCETVQATGCTGCMTLPVTFLGAGGPNIQGTVTYLNPLYPTPVNGIMVILEDASTGSTIATTVTGPNLSSAGQSGWYAFSNLSTSTTYNIYAAGDKEIGGNNATDALLIERHTASIGSPLSGLYLAAADVNESMSVNATDALYVKAFTVGLIPGYVDETWVFEAKENVTFPVGVTALTKNIGALSFGDVNGSYIPTGLKQASYLASIEDGSMTVNVNEPFFYNIRSNQIAKIGAMTMFLTYDQDRFEVVNINSSLEGMKYSIKDGRVAIAWSSLQSMNVKDNDVIISLEMKAKVATEAMNVFTINAGSEFADPSAERFDNFDLKMAKVAAVTGSGFSMMNYPNPFTSATEIIYTLPEQAKVTLVLSNMMGQPVKTLVSTTQEAGSYKVKVDAHENNLTPGVYLYKIEVEGATNSFVKTAKMTFTR